jgi:hypothetical protein
VNIVKLDTSGIDAYIKAIDLEMARLDREISEVFYFWTTRIFVDLVRQSPQWSGDLATNWNYSVKEPNYSYTKIENKATGRDGVVDKRRMAVGKIVYQKDMDPAVAEALTRMKSVAPPTWRDTVYFANATPIAPYVEAHSIYIRPVNLIQGQVAMIAYTVTKEQQNGRVL